MSCNGCPDKDKDTPFADKKGNVKNKDGTANKAAVNEPKKSSSAPTPDMIPTHPQLENMSYADYLVQKTIFREKAKGVSDNAVKQFSLDYKRIQVQELIDVVNHEDAGPLSPTQALQALHSLASLDDYKSVFNEFSGLQESIDKLYSELIDSKKIKAQWKP